MAEAQPGSSWLSVGAVALCISPGDTILRLSQDSTLTGDELIRAGSGLRSGFVRSQGPWWLCGRLWRALNDDWIDIIRKGSGP